MDIVALETIKRIQQHDHNNKYFLFCFEDQIEHYLENSERLQIVRIPRVPSPIIEQFILPLLALWYKLDLLHSTGNTSPLFLPCKRVITLHDIIYLEKKDKLRGGSIYQKIGKLYRRLIVPLVIKKADGLITVSETEKETILKKLPCLNNQLRVIPNAVSNHFTPRADIHTLTTCLKYKLPKEPFIFFLGNSDPKKNTINVLKAFHDFIVSSETRLHLVIADLSRNDIEKILKRYQLKNISDRVHAINYVNNEDLPDIYNKAHFFLYPSLRESFGIPILESMACGTPVITSGLHAMAETAGDAALLINPEKPEEISMAMQQLAGSPELRLKLRNLGFQRVSLFSWHASVQKLVNIYSELLSVKHEYKKRFNQVPPIITPELHRPLTEN